MYYDGQHYVHKNKRYNSVADLMADGVITIYLEKKAGSYIQLMPDVCSYEKSPYVTLSRIKRKTVNKSKPTEEFLPDIVVEYDKPHAFKPHTFKGFYWCEYCGNFLWGFIAQGVKCEGKWYFQFLENDLLPLDTNRGTPFNLYRYHPN